MHVGRFYIIWVHIEPQDKVNMREIDISWVKMIAGLGGPFYSCIVLYWPKIATTLYLKIMKQ